MATRFYFQANSAPVVNPPIDAGWGSTAYMVRRFMGTAQDAATETVAGSIPDLSSSLGIQLQSPPLAAQTVTGTITIVSRARELDVADNINKRVRAVRVYAADGSTLRATFNAYAQTASTSEFSTSFTGQIHAQNNGIGTVDLSAGDFIVVEIGFGMSASGDGSSQWETVLGGTGTDHAVSNGDTSGTVPWVEFSQTLVLQASAVTLTPATATLTAASTPLTPGVVTQSLTPAVIASGGGSTVPTPGSVTVVLTPAAGTRTAIAVSPTPLAVTVALTPAAASRAAVAVTPSPGPVTTSIQPALMASDGVTVQSQPLTVSVALSAAVGTVVGRTLTITPGLVTVALTRATATSAAIAAAGVAPGAVTAALQPANVPIAALDFGITPGIVNVDLTVAAVTVTATQTTPAGVGVSTLTLTPAVTTIVGLQVTAHPGLVLAPLTQAPGTWSGVAVGLIPGPVTMALTGAAATLNATVVDAVPGMATMALTSAEADWSGSVLGLVPGLLTTDTGFAVAGWSAVAVVPAPVEGVLLRPALATLAGRKTNPKGSVLPLNQYELPLARVLLDSLEEVLRGRTLNPPAHFSLRVGEQVAFDVSQDEDLCCEGLAYVKINRVYPATSFPNEDQDWSPCGPLAWAADLEMGILRCAPVGDAERIPTDAEWTDTTDLVHNDQAAMGLAIQQFGERVSPLTEWLARPWLPLPTSGACTGGTQTVTVGWIPC